MGRLGLPGWFRRTDFAYHSHVRLRFKFAAGLGEPWCRDGCIPQGCPLNMVFTVSLYVPWCRYFESPTDVKPQLYADNFKCSAQCPNALFDAARFTARYVRAVGHDVSPGKCVLLSTSKSVRKAMKLCDISGNGHLFLRVQLVVRDLGRHLDFTQRAGAGTLSCRVEEATAGVATVGALPLGFQVMLGLVRVSLFLLVYMLLRPLMCLPPRSVLLGLLLLGRCGPVTCLWLTLLRFLICLTGRLVLILCCILFGSGFA